MRLLIVADCRRLSAQIEAALRSLATAIELAGDFEDALGYLAAADYDVMIIDCELVVAPAILPAMHSGKALPPSLACCPRDDPAGMSRAMESGAAEFVLKPIDAHELRLRVRRLAEGHQARDEASWRRHRAFGPISLDLVTEDVQINGGRLVLTPRERAVLLALLRHPGEIVSKDRIAERIFALGDDTDPRSIETYVHRLRRKLDGSGAMIRTVRGLGYVLEIAC